MIALLHGEALKHKVAVQIQLADGLPPVQGDRVALQQVVLNLIVNAIEAMGSVGTGRASCWSVASRPPRARC